MSHNSRYRNLLNLGRKAGLTTRELYSALATRPAETSEHLLGRTDTNGYVEGYNEVGQRVYRPLGDPPRS
jgi:hypothetical protein